MPEMTPEKPRVEIEYCTGCRWMLRAAWLAQELLTTFEQELAGVTLMPGSGGVFEVRVVAPFDGPSAGASGGPPGGVAWSRAAEGGFPEAKQLKQRVRDLVAPGKPLGHSDTPPG